MDSEIEDIDPDLGGYYPKLGTPYWELVIGVALFYHCKALEVDQTVVPSWTPLHPLS